MKNFFSAAYWEWRDTVPHLYTADELVNHPHPWVTDHWRWECRMLTDFGRYLRDNWGVNE